MNLLTRLACILLLAGAASMLTHCEKDSLVDDPSTANQALDFRDGHIPDILCADLCDDNLSDFSDLEADAPFPESYNGVTLSAVARNGIDPLEVWVFDTDRTLEEAEECKKFDDPDLLFPGGPFGKVLIIQDEDVSTCANDRLQGGAVNVDFTALGTVTISCLTFFDTEEQEIYEGQPVSGVMTFFDADFNRIGDDFVPIPATEDGGAVVVEIGFSGVAYMQILFLGSGAVSSICTRVDTPECPIEASVLNFEEFEENEVITESGAVSITGIPTPAITFDTQDPDMCSTFDDYDMLLPLPIDGLPPAFGFGNVLVNQHKSKKACANADPRGGSIAFGFPTVSTIHSMAFVDTEEEGYVTFYGPGDAYISTLPIPNTPDGGVDFLVANVEGVAKMIVDFGGSGGIDFICYTPSDEVVEPTEYAGCTRDWKWWKKHKSQAEDCLDLESNGYCGYSYSEILDLKPGGRDDRFLIKEIVAADLNEACNGASIDIIFDAYDIATAELACEPFYPESKGILLQLQHFNKGLIGPGACE